MRGNNGDGLMILGREEFEKVQLGGPKGKAN